MTSGFLRKAVHVASLAIGLSAVTIGSASAGTLEDVQARGVLHCGTGTGLAGFSLPSVSGEWVGFDVDFCRAIAAAIFGDPKAVKFTPLTSQERFTALQSGEVDVLSRTTTWTFSRDVNLGLEFAGTTYYDGQGFLVRKDIGVEMAVDLDGARICIDAGTTTELNLADYFRTHGLEFSSVIVRGADDARTNYDAEACDSYTTDISALASLRASLPDPENHLILNDVISKEPLGLVVRHGDNKWADVVRWVRNAVILAEELGVTSKNVDEMGKSTNPEIRRLLGTEGNFGFHLGLEANWAAQTIIQVGNYSEIFERNVGKDTELGLERGLNAQWNKGGILFAPPMR